MTGHPQPCAGQNAWSGFLFRSWVLTSALKAWHAARGGTNQALQNAGGTIRRPARRMQPGKYGGKVALGCRTSAGKGERKWQRLSEKSGFRTQSASPRKIQLSAPLHFSHSNERKRQSADILFSLLRDSAGSNSAHLLRANVVCITSNGSVGTDEVVLYSAWLRVRLTNFISTQGATRNAPSRNTRRGTL